MDKMTLSEAARAMGGRLIGADETIDSVSIDSRSLGAGSLFIAIKGENLDGHDFVRTALQSGATAAVCMDEVADAPGPVVMVEDTRAALMALAAYNRSRCSLPVVGLTGSVGKTTSKDMVAAVLSSKYKTLATEGNLNNEIGLPRMCLRLDSSYQAAVLEMGMSGFGEISRLSKTARPTIGLITNIGVSHIEKLGSREGILEAKLEILDGMEPTAPLVLNVDNDMLLSASKSLHRPLVLYGIENREADCIAEDITQMDSQTSFSLTYKGEKHVIVIPAIGMHNVYNALAAFVCGRLLGVSGEEAAGGLISYVPDGRRQKIARKAGMTFIEDCYNASPDSIKASLSVLAGMECSGRRIAVLGDMLELGDYARKAHHDCGALLEGFGVDVLLAYGANAIYYIEGAGENVASRLYDDKAQLAEDLFDMLSEGDAVLFKGSRGMKLEEVISAVYQRLGC